MRSVMTAAARASITHYELKLTVELAGEDDTAGDLDIRHKCLDEIIDAAATAAHDAEAKQLFTQAVRDVLHAEQLGMSTAPCTRSFHQHVDGLASLLVDSLLLNSASFIWTQFAMLIHGGDDADEGEPPPSFVFANIDAPDDHRYG